MKKIFLAPILVGFLMAGTVNAQVNSLPSAGITPESPFYFLDMLGENLQEFFTFNPESKAKLQIKFAGERISEISAMVKKNGAAAKGITKAKTLLLANVAQAAEIIQKEKTTGKDVTKFAKNIDDAFDVQEKLLVQTFQDARKKLKQNRAALKQNLKKTDSDSTSLDAQIRGLDKDMNEMKGMQDDLNNLFNNEQKKIEKELNDEDKKGDKVESEKTKKDDEIEDVEIEKEDGEGSDTEIDNENEIENKDQKDSEDGKYSDTGEDEDSVGGED